MLSAIIFKSSPNIFLQSIPRAIVHIGPHKTASSDIQGFLSTHTEDLAAENLNWPPVIDRFSKNKHYDRRKSKAEMVAFFQESLQLNRNILLSAEGLDKLDVPEARVLQEILTGFNVTIVFRYPKC